MSIDKVNQERAAIPLARSRQKLSSTNLGQTSSDIRRLTTGVELPACWSSSITQRCRCVVIRREHTRAHVSSCAVADERDEPSPAVEPLQPLGKVSKFLVFLTTRMHFGVEIFFVISGYCITASGQSLRRSGCKISEYFRRRFVRIYPPFWCALACSFISCFDIDRVYPGLLKMTPWPLPVPWELTPAQWLGCVTLTGTWLGYFTGPPPELCFPIQSWTLCYEEQFYAMIGVMLAFSGRHFFRVAAARLPQPFSRLMRWYCSLTFRLLDSFSTNTGSCLRLAWESTGVCTALRPDNRSCCNRS